MGRMLDTFRGSRVPEFNIVGRRRLWYSVSGVLVGVSLVGLAVSGLRLSIDFKGGAVLRYPDTARVAVDDVRGALREFGREDAEIQIVAGKEISIRTSSVAALGDRQDDLIRKLAEQAGVEPDQVNVEDVGPTWGARISERMALALAIFLVLVSLYITLRFEGRMALGALAALGHDLAITAGVYVLVGRDVTPETIIAILTILGYSLYDTVVIYDKVKENTEMPALVAREGYERVVNRSLNQSVMRSVNTSVSTALPVLALLLFGGETLKDFAFALLVGVIAGTYSSIFVAAPLLATLRRKRSRRDRVSAGSGADGRPSPAAAARRTGHEVVVPPRPRKKKSAAKRRRR